ncbi:MAG: tryptophan synthase subunit alpha [Deltaproteobacteria bacterium]|uniref:tryptophan synthase subunit alpha n=1 Tax=Desulfobacula sp. TaxID=2593537 RepID=UPI0019CACF8C|nr:tryptophan synthase subunit alpha [Candidatus Desulfobacula maris]MBL6992884.1 tryptophan synthase subunit alpha [Desulfobacula sp.]
MNRIKTIFEEVKKKDERVLIGFVTAGDPDIDTSLELIKKMCSSGLDILELGIPFSDPTADGPVIQRSSARAIENGVNLEKVLEMATKIRKTTQIPIILFSYYNPVHAYGTEKFYNDSLKAGVDGVLIVDLPPEESREMTSKWTGDDLALIRLITPTTPLSRMKKISDSASGFLYLVSKTGVTGKGGLDPSNIEKRFNDLRSVTNLPISVGFGISTSKEVKAISKFADGIVIGSAFEQLIESNLENKKLPLIMGKKVKEYKEDTKLSS